MMMLKLTIKEVLTGNEKSNITGGKLLLQLRLLLLLFSSYFFSQRQRSRLDFISGGIMRAATAPDRTKKSARGHRNDIHALVATKTAFEAALDKLTKGPEVDFGCCWQ